MKNALTLEAFADWAEKQGDETYFYFNPDNCACSRYAHSLGINYVDTINKGGFWLSAESAALRAPKVLSFRYFLGLGRTRYQDLAKHIRKDLS